MPDPAELRSVPLSATRLPPKYSQLMRERVLCDLQFSKPITERYETKERKNLTEEEQSILHWLLIRRQIRIDEMMHYEEPGMTELDKVPFLLVIGQELGHRPDCFSFALQHYYKEIPEAKMEQLLSKHPAIYIKRNQGSRGEDIMKISKGDNNGYIVEGAKYSCKTSLASLSDLDLPLGPSAKETEYIVEAEIPIAKTSNGSTWEIRHIPPLDDTYAKVSQPGDMLNSISRGGLRQNTIATLVDVIKTHYPELTEDEISQQAIDFITRSKALAAQIKELNDQMQIRIAKGLIKPEDLKDPQMYEEVMGKCFSGTFYVSDITGVWDERGKLQPVIIEAQASASLPGENGDTTDKDIDLGIPSNFAYLAYEEALKSLNAKVSELQANLK